MNSDAYDQIAIVYDRMAAEAHYRPAAPSDGMGGIPRVGSTSLHNAGK
jgi:hypothetical protein